MRRSSAALLARRILPVLLAAVQLSGALSAWAGPEDPYSSPHTSYVKSPAVAVTENASAGFEVYASEVSSGDADGLARNQAWVLANLAESTKGDPSLAPKVVVAGPSDETLERTAAAIRADFVHEELPSAWERRLGPKFSNYLLDHSRITFTLVRGVMNGSVFAWMLILSTHIPPEIALPLGVTLGSLSSGFPYVQQGYRTLVRKFKLSYGVEVAGVEREIPARLVATKSMTELRAQLVKRIYKVSVMTAANLGLYAFGYSHFDGAMDVVRATTKNAVLPAGAQSFWDLTISHRANALIELQPQAAKRLALVAELKKTLNTTIALTLGIAKYSGIPLAEAGLIGMGALGSTQYVLQLYRDWKLERALRSSMAACDPNVLQPE